MVVSSGTETARASAAAHGSSLSTNDFLQAAGEANTQGTSRPNEAIIGTAQAIAAPPAPANRTPQPQVVTGFGGEVAVTVPHAADRPGGTHRRNHPVPASALPEEAAAPVSLADREAVTDAAVHPTVLPEIYDHSGHLIIPAPLKGSHDVLVHQNTMAMSDGLERIQDDRELDRLRADHELVSFPVSDSLRLNEDLPGNRRYARPWTVLFAQDISRDFFARFRQPLQVNSAVRTVGYQLRLQRVNGNAAAIDGDGASPHLTGQAIDLGKRGMSSAEIAWMRAYLLPLMQAGKIDVEEEFQQACFHISVYRHYAAGRGPVHQVAQLSTAPTHTAPAPADNTDQ